MTFKWVEKPAFNQSTVNPPTAVRNYIARGGTAAYVNAYALANTPLTVSTPQGTLYRQDIKVDEQFAYFYNVSVPYGVRKRNTGDYRVTFDTTGGTVHTKVSKESIARFPNTFPANSCLIGVHGSEVDGTDIVIPSLKMSVHFKHPSAVITIAKIKALSRLTGTVNSDTFLTFAPGEVLFLGCSGSEGTDIETEVTYQFACSQNVTGLTIGGISGIAKLGHHVAWVSYKDNVSSGYPIVQPKTIYIERVYDETPLAMALGFGS